MFLSEFVGSLAIIAFAEAGLDDQTEVSYSRLSRVKFDLTWREAHSESNLAAVLVIQSSSRTYELRYCFSKEDEGSESFSYGSLEVKVVRTRSV
ncbi:hypothetical protein AKJ16_DCAP09810 [Drosera capensis]